MKPYCWKLFPWEQELALYAKLKVADAKRWNTVIWQRKVNRMVHWNMYRPDYIFCKSSAIPFPGCYQFRLHIGMYLNVKRDLCKQRENRTVHVRKSNIKWKKFYFLGWETLFGESFQHLISPLWPKLGQSPESFSTWFHEVLQWNKCLRREKCPA